MESEIKSLEWTTYTHALDIAQKSLPLEAVLAFSSERLTQRFDYLALLEFSQAYDCQTYLSKVLNRMTPKEFDFFQTCVAFSLDFSERCSSELALGRGAALRAVNLFRIIRQLYSELSFRVLEINPVSATLAPTLRSMGFQYAAIECRAAEYMLQSKLWESAYPQDLIELAKSESAPSDSHLGQPGKLLHIPWWSAVLTKPIQLGTYDAVIIGASVFQLPRNATLFLLKLASELLAGCAAKDCFVIIPEWHDLSVLEKQFAVSALSESNLNIVHLDQHTLVATPLTCPNGSRAIDPATIQNLASAKVVAAEHPIISLIRDQEERDREWRFIDYDQIDTLSTLLVGSPTHLGAGENFLTFINR